MKFPYSFVARHIRTESVFICAFGIQTYLKDTALSMSYDCEWPLWQWAQSSAPVTLVAVVWLMSTRSEPHTQTSAPASNQRHQASKWNEKEMANTSDTNMHAYCIYYYFYSFFGKCLVLFLSLFPKCFWRNAAFNIHNFSNASLPPSTRTPTHTHWIYIRSLLLTLVHHQRLYAPYCVRRPCAMHVRVSVSLHYSHHWYDKIICKWF